MFSNCAKCVRVYEGKSTKKIEKNTKRKQRRRNCYVEIRDLCWNNGAQRKVKKKLQVGKYRTKSIHIDLRRDRRKVSERPTELKRSKEAEKDATFFLREERFG